LSSIASVEKKILLMKCVNTSPEDSSLLGCVTATAQVVSEIHQRVWNYAPTDSVLSLPKT
jgi:hypothetical protein